MRIYNSDPEFVPGTFVRGLIPQSVDPRKAIQPIVCDVILQLDGHKDTRDSIDLRNDKFEKSDFHMRSLLKLIIL